MGTSEMTRQGTLLFLLLAVSQSSADVCGPTFGDDDPSTWTTAAVTIIETVSGYIPVVGPWLQAAETIIDSIFSQGPKYTQDLSICVKHLITQEIEADKINQTIKFLEDWKPVIEEWKSAPISSNTSDTKGNIAGRLYDMAASQPLTYLPSIGKQETVLNFWFDIATTIVMAYEGTAVSFYNDSRYGNASNESCEATLNAKKYTSALKTIIDRDAGKNLNSSYFNRSATYDIGWDCVNTPCVNPFMWTAQFWLYDTYRIPNQTPDPDHEPLAWCDGGNCYCGSFEDPLQQDVECTRCTIFDPEDCLCHSDYYDGRCDKLVEDYVTEVSKNVTNVIHYWDKMMGWMDRMIEANDNHMQKWCS